MAGYLSFILTGHKVTTTTTTTTAFEKHTSDPVLPLRTHLRKELVVLSEEKTSLEHGCHNT